MKGNRPIILLVFQRAKWEKWAAWIYEHMVRSVLRKWHTAERMSARMCVELLFQEDCDCGFMTPSCFDDVIIVAFWAESRYSGAIWSHHHARTAADDKGTERGVKKWEKSSPQPSGSSGIYH